jgi:hypothetical protein
VWDHSRHPADRVSQRVRKRIEEAFGWCKDGRPMRKMRVHGYRNAGFMTRALLTIGCHNLLKSGEALPDPVPACRKCPCDLVNALTAAARARTRRVREHRPSRAHSKMNRSIMTALIDQRLSTAC